MNVELTEARRSSTTAGREAISAGRFQIAIPANLTQSHNVILTPARSGIMEVRDIGGLPTHHQHKILTKTDKSMTHP